MRRVCVPVRQPSAATVAAACSAPMVFPTATNAMAASSSALQANNQTLGLNVASTIANNNSIINNTLHRSSNDINVNRGISSKSSSAFVMAQQRRHLSFKVVCDSKAYNVDPPRHIPNREKVKMHPMVRKFVDGVLRAETTSLVYDEEGKRALKADGSLPTPLPARPPPAPREPVAADDFAEDGDGEENGDDFDVDGGVSAEVKSPEAIAAQEEARAAKAAVRRQQRLERLRALQANEKYMGEYDESVLLSEAVAGDLRTGNLLLSGMEGTGKRTNLILAGEELEAHGKRVAWISGDFFRVHSLGAAYMHYFFGLRVGDGLPIMEQMVGMFRRHAIILETTFEKLIPSLLSADVLIFDSIQHANANILKAFDRVCREVRQQPNLPFGGIRILAGANFWRLLRVSPASEYSGYIFQLPEMEQWFDHFYLTNVHHQKDPMLKLLTHKATLGELTMADCRQLEALSSAANTHPMAPTPMVDYAPALRTLSPAMCKHPTRRVLPAKLPQLRKTDFGNFLANILGGPFTYSNTFGLPERVTFEPGTPVHLVYATNSVPAGEHGIVESVGDANIIVNFPRLRQSVPIPLIRFRTFHVDYPEVAVSSLQFPLQNRTVTSGKFLVHGNGFWNIQIDGLYLTETNHLGLFLNKMRTFADFQATNLDKFMKLEGMVHEATRVYCRELMATGRSDTHITLKGDEWCRNCKSHVPAAEFFSHWRRCLKQLRWCGDCNRAIPLSKYAAHREKHQIVLCIDCASPVEWRNWEQHRLTCAPMMREISSENELLPERTRQVAMQYGLDRRDLHTVKTIAKSHLPNDKAARRTTKKSRALEEVQTEGGGRGGGDRPSGRSEFAALRPM